MGQLSSFHSNQNDSLIKIFLERLLSAKPMLDSFVHAFSLNSPNLVICISQQWKEKRQRSYLVSGLALEFILCL